MKLVKSKKTLVKSSLALLLSAAFVASVAEGQFSTVSAEETDTIVTEAPTKTPKPTATAKPTKTPKPARTPRPTITPKKPQTPKISCKAGNSKLIVKYNTVKNAAELQIWFRCGKDPEYYQIVDGEAKSNGTISVKKGTREIPVYKKGKYTIRVRAYSEGKKYHSKWVKKTVTVKKAKPSAMNNNEG